MPIVFCISRFGLDARSFRMLKIPKLLQQRSTMGRAAIFVVMLLFVGIVHSEFHDDWDVDGVQVQTLRALDDRNFEHDTQAATGQTTGSWLIFFTGSDCEACEAVESALLQVLSQNGGFPIIAKVNTSESTKTAKRFNVHQLPQLKLFRDRHMFSYRGQLSTAGIVSFIQDGWRNVPVEDVSKEVSLVNEIQEKFCTLYESIIKYLANRPGILACVGSITAMGGYLFTKQWLIKKQKQRPPGWPKKRAD